MFPKPSTSIVSVDEMLKIEKFYGVAVQIYRERRVHNEPRPYHIKNFVLTEQAMHHVRRNRSTGDFLSSTSSAIVLQWNGVRPLGQRYIHSEMMPVFS